LKPKHQKTGAFGGWPETALGAGVRIISFNNLQIDHLSKQQVLGPRTSNGRMLPRKSDYWNVRKCQPQFSPQSCP